MIARDQQVRELIAVHAADWFVANREGLSSKQRESFAAWLSASPVHVEEYLALAALARELPRAAEHRADALEELIERGRADAAVELHAPREAPESPSRWQPHRRWVFAGALSALFALGIAVTWMTLHDDAERNEPRTVSSALYATRHGEQRAHPLQDNSVIHLNSDSAVRVRFDTRERLAVLTAGQAAFDIAHDPSREFHVIAGTASIVAIGTRFDVRLEHEATLITVVQGQVRVEAGSPRGHGDNVKASSLLLTANQQVRVSPGDWPPTPIQVDASRVTSWLRHQIMFDHEPLGQVAQEMSRYAAKPIEIGSPALRDLRISGVFATDDPEAFIAFLRSLEGVTVEVTDSHIRVLQKRPKE